jgi:3-methyladenine DNA glycosylase AlkC
MEKARHNELQQSKNEISCVSIIVNAKQEKQIDSFFLRKSIHLHLQIIASFCASLRLPQIKMLIVAIRFFFVGNF